MNKFDIGDQVRLSVVITNNAGTVTDPTTVTCTLRKPDALSSTLSVTKDSTGNYHADVTIDQQGEWDYRWLGTGSLIVAEEGAFYVRTRKV